MIKLIWVERSPEVEKSSSNKPCGVFLLFVLLSEMQTQLKVSSIPVSGSIQGPSSRIDIYPFPICEPSIAHRCLPGQPLNHRPPLSHWAHGRRGRSRSDGRGDVAGWFAGAAWNYCRPTSASWKYHQNLLSFRMHGWVPAAALQLVARFDFFFQLHLCSFLISILKCFGVCATKNSGGRWALLKNLVQVSHCLESWNVERVVSKRGFSERWVKERWRSPKSGVWENDSEKVRRGE